MGNAPWEGSTRRERLPRDWPTRRLRALQRDGWQCQAPDQEGAGMGPQGPVCGLPATCVDHVVRGDDHSPTNLMSLCNRHHMIKTQREANEERKKNSETRIKKGPIHPGFL